MSDGEKTAAMATKEGGRMTEDVKPHQQHKETQLPKDLEKGVTIDPSSSTVNVAEAAIIVGGDVEIEKDPFHVGWEGGDADPRNPRSWSKTKKWIITFIVSGCALCVTCASSIYAATYDNLLTEFPGTPREEAIAGLSTFLAGLATGPMLLAPLSEFYGRRPIFIYSFLFFIIFLIPCAEAHNMATLLIGRFLNGFAGSAFMSVSGGAIGDMWFGSELGAPMMIFTAAPFVGPELGPLIGGFINQNLDWRWTFYVLIIWAAVMLVLILAFSPETYHPVLLKQKAQKLRKETGEQRYWSELERLNKSIPHTIALSVARPFQLLWFEPMVLLLCLLTALLLGILYLFFQAFPLVFGKVHHMDLQTSGLTFLGLFVGMVAGILTDPLWRKQYIKLVASRGPGGESGSIPEFRLPPAIFGVVLVPIGMFWFGFTTYPSIHWIVPIIGSAFFAMGTLLVFSGIFTFLVQAYPLYAASALAANAIMRCTFAAVFPLFSLQLYEKLGNQWATALLSFMALALAPLPYIFFRYGERIRKNSRYAKS
ncbi:major facilitator superfamily domain-containing protein [Peziza echinospora]|nr:major facilitator superfamily domain-containing protein [Peziza echinospora]